MIHIFCELFKSSGFILYLSMRIYHIGHLRRSGLDRAQLLHITLITTVGLDTQTRSPNNIKSNNCVCILPSRGRYHHDIAWHLRWRFEIAGQSLVSLLRSSRRISDNDNTFILRLNAVARSRPPTADSEAETFEISLVRLYMHSTV